MKHFYLSLLILLPTVSLIGQSRPTTNIIATIQLDNPFEEPGEIRYKKGRHFNDINCGEECQTLILYNIIKTKKDTHISLSGEEWTIKIPGKSFVLVKMEFRCKNKGMDLQLTPTRQPKLEVGDYAATKDIPLDKSQKEVWDAIGKMLKEVATNGTVAGTATETFKTSDGFQVCAPIVKQAIIDMFKQHNIISINEDFKYKHILASNCTSNSKGKTIKIKEKKTNHIFTLSGIRVMFRNKNNQGSSTVFCTISAELAVQKEVFSSGSNPPNHNKN